MTRLAGRVAIVTGAAGGMAAARLFTREGAAVAAADRGGRQVDRRHRRDRDTAGYSASKAGVAALSRVAAVKPRPHRIGVNALYPGATETPMAKHQREGMLRRGLPVSSELIDRAGVLGRIAEPEEMADGALLASDDAGWSAMSGVRVQAFARQAGTSRRRFFAGRHPAGTIAR